MGLVQIEWDSGKRRIEARVLGINIAIYIMRIIQVIMKGNIHNLI